MSEESSGGKAKRWDRKRHWSLNQKLALFSVIISVGSLFFAISALLYTVHNEREMKTIDLLTHFEQRYDYLVYEQKSNLQAMPEEESRPLAEAFYRRFWDLQFEQYQEWREGYITPKIFNSWMRLRHCEWEQNEKIGGVTYQEGWQGFKKYLGSEDDGFSAYMEDVFKNKRANCPNGP